MAAAMTAAQEVSADTLAADDFQIARAYFFKANREYRLKNFLTAREYAIKSTLYAEKAEFAALKAGGVRVEKPITDPFSEDHLKDSSEAKKSTTAPALSAPYANPSDQKMSVQEYERLEQQKKEQSKDKK